jgi:hypothetical protein
MPFNGRAENKQIQDEMQPVIDALKEKGITHNTKENELTGLGDVLESTLQTFGVTEERFKAWFGLKECSCNERKKFLNNLFSWRNNK